MKREIINCLIWLTNKVSETTTYESWSNEFKCEQIKESMDKFNEALKKHIDWDNLTDDDCKDLHFGRWQGDEDVVEEIEYLTKDKDNGNLSEEEYQKRVACVRNTLGLRLIPLYLVPLIPIGTKLTSIDGEDIIYDGHNIDLDIRFGCIAFGIKPNKSIN